MKKYIALALVISMQAPVFAAVLSDSEVLKSVAISENKLPLNSRLKKRYDGYKVSLTNNYGSDLRISAGTVDNGVSGSLASQSAAVGMGNIFWGIPLGLLGIGIAWCVVNSKNHKSEVEGFSYPGQAPSAVIGKGETISFNALVPIGQDPHVKLTMATLD